MSKIVDIYICIYQGESDIGRKLATSNSIFRHLKGKVQIYKVFYKISIIVINLQI